MSIPVISLRPSKGRPCGLRLLCLFGLLPTALLAQSVGPLAAQQQTQRPSAFQNIGDPVQRSRTLFTEIGKVTLHKLPSDQPLQGADRRIRFPPSHRPGPNVFGDACTACHTDRNFTVPTHTTFQSIPGHPRSELAPLSMAWEGNHPARFAGSSRTRPATAAAI